MSIGQANDRAGGGEPSTGTAGAGDEGGRPRDEGLVTQLRTGDETAFGQLFDAWVDPVYDRISNRGFSTDESCRIESDAFATVHRRMAQQSAAASSDSFRVMVMRAARQEVAASSSSRIDTSLPVGPYAEDRLTRGTDVRALASDPAVAALLWQAAELLGEQVREVLDLSHRHGLTSAEVAAVLQEPPGAIEEILRKVAAGYGAVVRARIVWRQGAPTHSVLAEQVAGESRFDASMVRRVAEHLRECESCRTASQVPLPPIDVFAAIPIAVAPPGVKDQLVENLDANGISMVGSSFAARALPDDLDDLDDDDDERVDRAAIVAALAETGIDEGHTPLAAPPRPDDPTTVVPAVGDADEPEDDGEHPAAAAATGAVAGAATAAALGRAAGLGDLSPDAMADSGAGLEMLPGGLGAVPRADFGPDIAPPPKAPIPSTILAASSKKGGGGGTGTGGEGGSRNRWIVVAVATVAVVALLAYVLMHTSSSKKAQNLAVTNHATTTTEAPSTTDSPSTTSGPVTTVRHPGKKPPPKASTTTSTTTKGSPTTTLQVTTTTQGQQVTTTTSPWFPGLVVNFSITGQNPITLHKSNASHPVPYWSVTQTGAPNLTWSVTADVPINVKVTGDSGFPTVFTPSGTTAQLCTVPLVGTDCQSAPGTYRYYLTVTDKHGHSAGTEIIPLTVNPHS